jgi:transposase
MSQAHIHFGIKRPELSVKERELILKLKSEGKSERVIACIVKCSQSTVNRTVRRFNATQSNNSRYRSGRPSIISAADRRYINQLSTRCRRKTVSQIMDEFNVSRNVKVSKATVRRVLHSWGLRGCVAANKPLLRLENVRKRIKFCKKILKMKKSEILKIFNTDETKVELFGDKKNGYCWRKPGERFHRNCVKPTIKHGGGCIMVWGGISAQGQSRLRLIEGIFYHYSRFYSIGARFNLSANCNYILKELWMPKCITVFSFKV